MADDYQPDLGGLASVAQGSSQGGVSDDELVQIAQRNFEEADSSRSSKKEQWDDNWSVYNNQFDFSEKADWQSQGYLPKFKMAVRVASYTFRRALISGGPLFKVRGLNPPSKMIQNDVSEAVHRALYQSDIVGKFTEAVTAGLLESSANLKVYPVQIKEKDVRIHPEQIVKVRIDPVSSYHLYSDPRGRNRYRIHLIKRDFSEFKKLCEAKIYDPQLADKVQESFVRLDEEYERARREGEEIPTTQPSRKEVELWEYWGDVDDDKGNRVLDDVTFTIVNRQYLARKPQPNPLGFDPFVVGPIIRTPFATISESFGDALTGLARMMNENYNALNDQNLASSMYAFEIDLSYVRNHTQLQGGFYPGKTILTHGVPPGGKAIREVKLGTLSQENLLWASQLDREFQNASGINEFISAVGGTGSKTATEVKIKSAQSASLMREMASDIEESILRPLVERVYMILRDFNPEVFGDRIRQVSLEDLHFDFDVSGMSSFLENEDELQKVMMFLNVMGKTPLAQRINWNTLGSKLVRSLGWDEDDVLVPEQEKPALPGVGPTTPQDEAQLGQGPPPPELMSMLMKGNGGVPPQGGQV